MASVSGSTAHAFRANTRAAIASPELQAGLARLQQGLTAERRMRGVVKLPEFERLRDAARDIKNHTLAHLDHYLAAYERAVVAGGGHVHWCETAADARQTILAICRRLGAATVTKGKTMIAEEIDLNEFLAAEGIEPIETDLGEYIVQLAGERPSHIIAPAVHKSKDQVSDLFFHHHQKYGKTRRLTEPPEMIDEVRGILRDRFLDADVGITGANFLVAETGSSLIVTNEGNGDLTQTLPKAHIVLATLEKLVPTLEDVATLLRVLARSGTGQEFSAYTTVSTGPRREGDADGPGEYHVVLLDNGRSRMLAGEFREMLRCIRCGACMNQCPVFAHVGGHAYGWVYVGPMGAVLTPHLIGLEEAHHLPSASTFCGACESVCPVKIPLPALMRHLREAAFEARLPPAAERSALGLWRFAATRPGLWRLLGAAGARLLARMGGAQARLRRLPLAGGWTSGRDLPAPEGETFHTLWRQRGRR
ncbi:MAG: iron-sulfur cluster-binding protein [Alphaproteobacteria bacterium]|nr:iron-sulfur cluster-binding protein [Alphaproteobacteria bacterium]